MADYREHRNHSFLKYRIKPTSWNGEEWTYAEIKEDGRRVAVINNAGKMEAFGRKHYINIWPKVAPLLKDITVPENTMVEIEHIRDHVEHEYCRAFALPVLNGEPPWSLTYEDARKTMQDMGFTLVEQAKLPVLYSREKLEEYINSRKIEGLVLKLRTLAGWYKLKPVLTADCIVTDYFYGEGKYTGMMGALEASVYDEHGTLIPVAHVGGGWKDVDRRVKHADVMGRVMEVKYDCILKNRLRFPRFYRWRDDKPANECLLPERGR